MSRSLGLALKWTVGLGLLLFLLLRVDLGATARTLLEVAPIPLLGSFVAFAAGMLLHAWRWHRLLASRDARLGFGTAVRLVLEGHFLSLFLPGTLGGDVYRAAASRPAAASLLQSAGLVMIERYCGFLATFVMALVAILASDFAARQPLLSLLVLGLFLLFLLPLPVAASPRLAALIERLCQRFGLPRGERLAGRIHAAARRVAAEPGLLAVVLGLSLGIKLTTVAIFHFLATGLELPISLVDLLVFLPIHTVVSALPITISGLGVREANTVAFFTQLGLTGEQATGLAFLVLIWVYVTALPGGLFLLADRPRHLDRPDRPDRPPASSE